MKRSDRCEGGHWGGGVLSEVRQNKDVREVEEQGRVDGAGHRVVAT